MSFGFSIGDFVSLVQLAHKTFRNCQKAGEEYAEITCEVRCLHSVLKTLRAEAERSDSKLSKQDNALTSQLVATIKGCKNVLETLDYVLTRYGGLNAESQTGLSQKLWQRFKFGSKTEELGVVRGKLITYTSTISILIDTMQIQITDRVESKIDGGFAEMTSQFGKMRKEIFEIASHARAQERKGMAMSTLSLSTYAGDEKVVWRDFRRELLQKGFRSQSLDKYKHVLQAYMLKLDQSGLLDRQDVSSSDAPNENPWWAKRMFTATIHSLADLEVTELPTSSSEHLPLEDHATYLIVPEAASSSVALPTIVEEESSGPKLTDAAPIDISQDIPSVDTDVKSTSSLDQEPHLIDHDQTSSTSDFSDTVDEFQLRARTIAEAHMHAMSTSKLARKWSHKVKIEQPKSHPRDSANENTFVPEIPVYQPGDGVSANRILSGQINILFNERNDPYSQFQRDQAELDRRLQEILFPRDSELPSEQIRKAIMADYEEEYDTHLFHGPYTLRHLLSNPQLFQPQG